MLKNKSRISSNCSFRISRLSNQNRLHLCHDRLWFSGPQQLEKGFLSSPGHNPSQPHSHCFFIGNTPLLSYYFSWHSFVRWRAMRALPGLTILGMRSLRSLRVFQVSFAHALTRGASLVAASPRPNAAAFGSAGGPRRGGRAAAEVRRLRGGEGHRRSQTPELSQPWNCVGEESGCLLLAFNICPR